MKMKDRFRGYLPVILDLETGGFDSGCNPILELACAFVGMESNQLQICEEFCWAVSPFSGAIVEESSLKITGIDLDDPLDTSNSPLSKFSKSHQKFDRL